MEPSMHSAGNMLALKKSWAALGLGIVACSASSPTVPPGPEDNSVKVPPFTDSAEQAPSQPEHGDAPDKNISAPRDISKRPADKTPECGKEKEPNNSVEQATEIDKCMTGELSDWQDSDHLKITAPEGVTDMIIDHAESKGKVNYTVTIPSNGGGAGGTNNFNMSFSDKAPKTKIKPGQAYIFSLKWDNNGQGNVSEARPWMLRVSFE